MAAKFMVSDQLDNNSAYQEAIVSKILAHPNVLQTFDFQASAVTAVPPCMHARAYMQAGRVLAMRL